MNGIIKAHIIIIVIRVRPKAAGEYCSVGVLILHAKVFDFISRCVVHGARI